MTATRRLLMTVDAVGGVWSYALELAASLAPRGFDTVLALLGPEPSAAQRRAAAAIPGVSLIATGQPLDWLADDAAAVARAAAAVAALAAAERVDLVQLNQPALAAAIRTPLPVVAVAHSCVGTWWDAVEGGALPASLAWQADLFGAGLLAADRVVCPSRAFADQLARRYRLGAAPAVVHNGSTMPQRDAAPAADEAFTAGRLWDRGKDVATLDAAAAALAVPFSAAGPIVGPHGERIATRHLALLGELDQPHLAARLSRRPVFVSAARYEPFGLAVLEAALAGCALVLSDIATFRELWDGAAMFVAPNDAGGFAAAVADLIADPVARADRGECARQRAARYTPDRMADGMATLYRDLLAVDHLPTQGQRAA